MTLPILKFNAARTIYQRASLERLFEPKRIAIVGISSNPASFGARTLTNLEHFDGHIDLISAKYAQLRDRPCIPSLEALDHAPDCVVIAVPRDSVQPVVEQAIAMRAGGVMIYASGYAETGRSDLIALQSRLQELTVGTATRVFGPNCLGIVNGRAGMNATFSFTPAQVYRQGARSIGLVSQSGALGVGLAQAVECGSSFSHVLMSGNSCDVDIADQIAYLAEDPHCDVIACVFESTAHPARLIDAGGLAQRNRKPVIVFKMATGASGADAAMSHTGALSGSAAGYAALFDRAGFVVVDQFEDLLETSNYFAKAGRCAALGVAILTSSGGAGIVGADQADAHGVPLPQPGPALKAVLQTHIPEFGAARNPCDVTAQILNDPVAYPACAEAFLREPNIGLVAVPYGFAHAPGTQRVVALGPIARQHGKFVCVYAVTGWREGPGFKAFEEHPDIGLFRSTGHCFRTIAAWQRWWARSEADDTVAPPRLTPAAIAEADGLLDGATPGTALTESVSKSLLRACGIATVTETLVASEDEAVLAARAGGFPVAIKVESVDLPHKTEAGVVQLGLADEGAVRKAYALVMRNALRHARAERIRGVLVQPMIPAGVEILVGARVDPLLGPMVVVGLGGVMVELLQDTCVALAPVGARQARAMLERLRSHRLLTGFRGSAPIDQDALADVIVRVSELISGLRHAITEIDVNPLICSGERIIAVDALVVPTGAAAVREFPEDAAA